MLSQNGWPALEHASQTLTFTAGGRQWRAANTSVVQVFKPFIDRFAVEVEPITGGELDDWSWANRLVRDSTTVISNHASATGVDINALTHARGARHTFTSTELHALVSLLRDFPVIRWGGNYGPKSTIDEMHFELNVTPAGLRAWLRSRALAAEHYVPAGGVAFHPAAITPIKKPAAPAARPPEDWLSALSDEQQRELYAWVRDLRAESRGPGDKGWPVEGGLALSQTDMLRLLVHEVTGRLPSRVPGSTYRDTMLGYAANADAYGYAILRALAGFKTSMDALARAAAAGTTVDPKALTKAIKDAMATVPTPAAPAVKG